MSIMTKTGCRYRTINGKTVREIVDFEVWTKYHREYRKQRREKLRAYNKEYNRQWRLKNGYQNEAKSDLLYPHKRKARELLRIAVARGEVKKYPCEVCGNKRSQGHHDDYNKPLEVRWFCALHHKQLHSTHSDSSNSTGY